MNKMKDFAIESYNEMEECFQWRTKTFPKLFKIKSVRFLKAFQVSVLSGISLGASATFILLSMKDDAIQWWVGILVALVAAFLYLFWLYYFSLRKDTQ